MSAPIIFSGNNAKLLKSNLDFFGAAQILTGTVNPTSSATTAQAGSLYLNTSTGAVYRKTDNGSSTNWLILGSSASGDINETSFSLTNNQASAADITGFAFANGSVRSFEALVSVYIDATSDLFESFKLQGIQRGADWVMSQTSVGDASLITFSITTAGQIQYTSPSYTGFVSGILKFRAITLSV